MCNIKYFFKHTAAFKIRKLVLEHKRISEYQDEQLVFFGKNYKDTRQYEINEFALKWIDLKIEICKAILKMSQ